MRTTYDEDRCSGVDPWEMGEHGQVAKVIDGEVPQHPHGRESMEGIQEHHPYNAEAEYGSGTRAGCMHIYAAGDNTYRR